MIYTAVILACLVSAPTQCRSYELELHSLSASPVIAELQAERYIVRWFKLHRCLFFVDFRLEAGWGA